MARERDAGTSLKNPEVEQALADAVAGDSKRLTRFLLVNVNLRGQAPTPAFALAFSEALAAYGERADDLIQGLLAVTDIELGSERGHAHLQALLAQVLCARILQQDETDAEWEILMGLAGQGQKPIRDGVVAGLSRIILAPEGGVELFLERVGPWMDGFLQACVVLEVMGAKSVLAQVREGDEAFQERIQEGLTLAVDASRSLTRSQGRRTLLTVLGQVLPPYIQRFPDRTEWLMEQVGGRDPDVREMWEQALVRMEKMALPGGTLDALRHALDGSREKRRDPKSYVGSTRGRGRKAERRAERK